MSGNSEDTDTSHIKAQVLFVDKPNVSLDSTVGVWILPLIDPPIISKHIWTNKRPNLETIYTNYIQTLRRNGYAFSIS